MLLDICTISIVAINHYFYKVLYEKKILELYITYAWLCNN